MKTNKTTKSETKTVTKAAAKTEPNLAVVSKNDIRNIASYANKLLRGIDNETASVKKEQESINKRIEKVNESIVNLTKAVNAVANAAITNSTTTGPTKTPNAPVKAAPVNTATAKTASKTAGVTKVAAKKAAPTKETVEKKAPKTAAKVASSATASDVTKTSRVVKAVEERPALKTVIDRILAGKAEALRASVIYGEACRLHGQWSRQSLYNALKDTNRYQRIGDGNDASYKLLSKTNTVSDDETEKMINRVESSAVANVL